MAASALEGVGVVEVARGAGDAAVVGADYGLLVVVGPKTKEGMGEADGGEERLR
jgi:hypothetical protein